MLIANTSELNINTQSIGGFQVDIIPKGVIEVSDEVGKEILNRFGFLKELIEEQDEIEIEEAHEEEPIEAEGGLSEMMKKLQEEPKEEVKEAKTSFFKKTFEFGGKQYKTKAAMKAAKTRAKNKK